MGIEELCGILNERGEEVIFLGDGVAVYREKITRPYESTIPFCTRPVYAVSMPGSVAVRGMELLRRERHRTAQSTVRFITRTSQAERERREKAIIRPMRDTDLYTGAEMENASYPDPWTVKGFEGELSNTAAMCVVIEDTTGVVGYSVSILTVKMRIW